MSNVSIYFEVADGGIRMGQTTKVESIIRRLSRASRGKGRSAVIAAFVVDRARAKKLRHLLNRAWASQYRGGGIFTILPAEIERVAAHLSTTWGLTCHGLGNIELSPSVKSATRRLFAKGEKEQRTLTTDDVDETTLDEMLSAGIITRHTKRATGETVYRGTERAKAITRRVMQDLVPERGKLAAVETKSPITKIVVAPDPSMTRELLVGRMVEAEAAGGDPLDVAHKQGYRAVAVNLRELIGGLAAVTEIDEFQQKGAAHFRRVAEQGQLGGARAIDYAAVKVDSSTINVVVDVGASARAEYEQARQHLGIGSMRLAVAERMIVAGQSVSEIAAAFYLGKGGTARGKITGTVREAATALAQHFGYIPSRRAAVRVGGDRPDAVPHSFRSEILRSGRFSQES